MYKINNKQIINNNKNRLKAASNSSKARILIKNHPLQANYTVTSKRINWINIRKY